MSFIKTATEWIKLNVLAIKRFCIIAGSITGVALFVSVGVTIVLLAMDDGGRPPDVDYREFVFIPPENPEDYMMITLDAPANENGEGGRSSLIPARTNFILLGIDHQQLADAIMVGTFYRDTGNIHLMSVPRDMVVRIPPHRMERMRADGISPPRTLKVNEMRSHGGRVHGIYYMMEQIGEMFGVEFDIYVEVELAAFRRVVDAIGGVYMDIPRRLFYRCYNHPPITINVPAGRVLLDGNMAEGVVRYRQWPMGDLERNRMQQQFMTELISQATTPEALLRDPFELISIVHDNVRSNIGLGAIAFVPYLPRVSGDSVRTFTMQGTIGAVDNRSGYFIPDTASLPGILADVFFYVFDDTAGEEVIQAYNEEGAEE